MLLAGLSTNHKIGLGVVAIVFIGFALMSSFLAPRRRADFPGKNGLSVFVIACFVLFAAMIGAVEIFGAESEAKGAGHEAAAAGHTIQVQEKEFKITLASSSVAAGPVTFVITNVGKIPHDLAIQGGTKTPPIAAGKTGRLSATLKKGTVTLYCSIPGHRQLGMVAKLTVT